MIRSLCRAALVWGVVALAVGIAAAADEKPQMKAQFGDGGLNSLTYGDAELLAGGKLSVSARAPGKDGKPAGVKLDGAKTEASGKTVTFSSEALTVTVAYRDEADALLMNVKIRNGGSQTLSSVQISPMTLQFPRRPRGGAWFWGYQVTTNNDGEPGVVVANWGPAKLLACVDEIERPVTFGFAGNYGNSTTNGLTIQTQQPLAPGATAEYKFSLRFAPGDADDTKVAADVYGLFAKAYPYKLNWPDRRPIGAIMACQSAQHWKTNPCGWLNDPKIDVTTPEGRADFAKRMLAYADGCVRVIKDVGGQGMIMWSHCCPRQSRHSRPPGVSGLILAGFRDFGRPWAFL